MNRELGVSPLVMDGLDLFAFIFVWYTARIYFVLMNVSSHANHISYVNKQPATVHLFDPSGLSVAEPPIRFALFSGVELIDQEARDNMLAMQRRAVARVARFSTAAATQEATSSANLPLRVELRETEGSRAARRLRKQGFLPGILYGEGVDGAADKVLVSLETRAFEKLHRKLWTSVENQVFDLQVGDRAAPVKAYMRDLQLDPGESKCAFLCDE